tara:strand:+ start:269 stop:742 length:474 start_codon:yes stop_codon:yes gene_type:complete
LSSAHALLRIKDFTDDSYTEPGRSVHKNSVWAETLASLSELEIILTISAWNLEFNGLRSCNFPQIYEEYSRNAFKEFSLKEYPRDVALKVFHRLVQQGILEYVNTKEGTFRSCKVALLPEQIRELGGRLTAHHCSQVVGNYAKMSVSKLPGFAHPRK